MIGQYGNLIYIGLFLLIFIETGLVVVPFLPGDSLLFLCGSLAALSKQSLNIWLLLLLLTLAAVGGDSVNFEIGKHLGHYLTTTSKLNRFIKPQYLKRSQTFFNQHGKLAIFLGRFIPIIRTFIPFTAGIGQMNYRDFIIYNISGGFSWVALALGSGYFFGNIAFIKVHFELILIAIVIISLLPVIVMTLRKKGGAIQ
ncbi:DedA protein (DSG-1 protein) [Agrilactobacillus composti DSM 18527 = JCM 14202]|uniref:DedA protein (DSG-1 protein) n=1 Tax=Agrilactobacillus composti DSM 18527 = JCM 14202 TaxID=1423734 RepID=A0A0R1Y015_9LACO|nr:DedA protein (DSG-1 protein) [Agrilactobacillus composti DSM 18527 = JCM 14202]